MSKPGKFRLDTSFEGTFNKLFDLTGDGKATFEDFFANAFRTGENLPEVYEFCRVLLNQSGTPYSYLTNGLDLNIGDKVIVPVGADNCFRSTQH